MTKQTGPRRKPKAAKDPNAPTKGQARLLAKVRMNGGALCFERGERGGGNFFLPGGERVSHIVARNCIRRGFLVANQDVLFGGIESQSYREAGR